LQSTEAVSRYIASQVPGSRLAIYDDRGGGLFSSEESMAPGILLVEEFIRGLVSQEGVKTDGILPSSPISAREAQVLRLIAGGRSNREIADDLVLSVRTVERHITNLYAKIGARGKADATAYALRHGLA
jgi:DNA-binding NarL/FixJ family response regulator